ncbi:MAG: S-layer protein, partial [Chloroflexi bacterium]
MTSTSFPRLTTPFPHCHRPLPAILTLNLILALLFTLIQSLTATLPSLAPSPAPPLPYARADSNFFIENRGQFDPNVVAILPGRNARLVMRNDGQLQLSVNGAPPLTLSFNVEGSHTAPQVNLHGPLAT